ncbi:hypothetical protein L1049_004920 [Liquidambar formosana]|uniref:Uncharacterized protein n=1 Tax=Liquidambar formosana TaxID=63359 RepID=A0AAP0WW60_LIQFO
MEGGGAKSQSVDEEEEKKIDAFFALIRNIRDAHDQLVGGSNESKAKGNKQEKEMKSTWIPSFKLEDFKDDAQVVRSTSPMLPSSSGNKEQRKTEKREELDLNLSL